MVTKKLCAPSAPYTSRVITLEALKVRLRKIPSTSIGSRVLASTTRNADPGDDRHHDRDPGGAPRPTR